MSMIFYKLPYCTGNQCVLTVLGSVSMLYALLSLDTKKFSISRSRTLYFFHYILFQCVQDKWTALKPLVVTARPVKKHECENVFLRQNNMTKS